MNKTELRRPGLIYLFSVGYLLLGPLSVWYQVEGYGRELTTYDILLMIAYVVVAYGVWRVRPWSWYLVMGHTVFLFGQTNYLMLMEKTDVVLSLQFDFLLIFIFCYFAQTNARSPFHNPALRWWERQFPRYGLKFPAVVTLNGQEIACNSFNLSMEGCYVALGAVSTQDLKSTIHIKLNHPEAPEFEVDGQIRWVGEFSEEQPAGAGIKFKKLTKAKRMLLKGIISIAEAKATA